VSYDASAVFGVVGRLIAMLVGFAAVAIGAFFFSGLAAVIWPGEKRERKRYERATRDPWDELSQGSDPTAR